MMFERAKGVLLTRGINVTRNRSSRVTFSSQGNNTPKALSKHHVTPEYSQQLFYYTLYIRSMLIHSFALNNIDLNNVVNIGTVFVQHVK